MSTFTLEPIRDILHAIALAQNFDLALYFGGFQQLEQEVMNQESGLSRHEPQGIVFAWSLQDLSPMLWQSALDLTESDIQTEIENLMILPAGHSSSHPGELVTSTRMNALIQELQASYQNSYIIIDSTPITATSEVNALSRMTDGVIFVIKADMIRRDVVKRELKTIASEKILGVVLNCAEFETSDYYGKYYNKYYCKY